MHALSIWVRLPLNWVRLSPSGFGSLSLWEREHEPFCCGRSQMAPRRQRLHAPAHYHRRMSARKNHLDALAVSMLLGCCLFWGFQQVLIKMTVAEVAPVYQAAIRFIAAAVLLVAWCVLRGIRLTDRDGSFWPGLLAGLLFTAEFAGIYIGLQHTAASRLTIFLYTSPFWVAALLSLTMPSERLKWPQWIGLLLAFSGVVVAFGRTAGGAAGGSWFGDFMGLVAGAAWGLTTVVIRSTSIVRLAPEKLLLYQVAVAAVALPVLSLLLGETWTTSFSGFAIASLAAQAAVGAFASYLAWMWMIGRYPATKMSSLTFLAPVFALAFGVLLLREPVTASLIIAIACVAAGIVLVNRRA